MQNSPYKFIYFDLDDTLLDHRAAERAGLADVYARFPFFDAVEPEALFDTYREVNSVQWSRYSQKQITRPQLQRNRFEQTLQQLELDSSRYEELGRYYMGCYRNHWQWMEGAKEVFDRIRGQYPVGILTNGFTETQQKKFEAFNLYQTADHTVISEEVGVLKPDPGVFEYATQKSGVAPAEILYVGDSFSSDIEGGANYGWNTAWFTQNGEAAKHRKADFVFNDFNDLADMLKVQG
ncbi:MAG TPA: YjjG family noncanonical pyrimidine nucleotidase [Fodinibius sp.]|nr:YjjG family noncanonical pyrimidine nucleotidase [Fodinibius sp.]